jgi:hypothetical protein
MDEKIIAYSVAVACKNWDRWRDVFEDEGRIRNNPLLSDPVRFSFFLQEYSVFRTIAAGKHDQFRQALVSSREFGQALNDSSGAKLDAAEQGLRCDFGTHDGARRMISVLSKVAAFLRPATFVAWDQYAKKGVMRVLNEPSSAITCYYDYLSLVNRAWNGALGKAIREWFAKNRLRRSLGNDPRYLRRVLDVCLMREGDGPSGIDKKDYWERAKKHEFFSELYERSLLGV